MDRPLRPSATGRTGILSPGRGDLVMGRLSRRQLEAWAQPQGHQAWPGPEFQRLLSWRGRSPQQSRLIQQERSCICGRSWGRIDFPQPGAHSHRCFSHAAWEMTAANRPPGWGATHLPGFDPSRQHPGRGRHTLPGRRPRETAPREGGTHTSQETTPADSVPGGADTHLPGDDRSRQHPGRGGHTPPGRRLQRTAPQREGTGAQGRGRDS